MITIQKSFLVLLIGVWSCNDATQEKKFPDSQLDSGIDKIQLADLAGQTFNLKEYSGKTLFINFWATWCKPCLEEMPSIQKAKELLKDNNIEFLFASEETAEQIDKFRTRHEYNFKYVRVENLPELNIMALPTTFIFDKEGKLVFSEMGYRKWDDKENIDLLLNITKSK